MSIYLIVGKTLHKYKLNVSYQKFESFLINIREYFKEDTNTIHKARNELKIIEYDNVNTVVKSFKIPNIINKTAYTYFRDSKAKKSYKNSIKIGDFTPTPIGYIEFHANGLLNESYFVSEEFKYDFTIREPLLDSTFKDKENIFKAFAKFTLKLHNNNIFHKDYSPGNILIKVLNGNYIFKIVDINRMKFFNLAQEDRAKNFAKLWASDLILTVMAGEYQKHYKCDENFITQVLYYSNKNKKMKNLKKRLKGQEVND
jgi:serine/threonine protein kinase